MEEIQVINEKSNPLFNRKEIKLLVSAEATPKTKEAEELVAKQFSSNSENIKIKKISGNYGVKKFTITANIYDSKELKDKTEIKPSKEKKAKS
jgi:ribosomal protein S24E